ncbi:MAG: hypothetical protein QW231_00645, partial [Candidatus Bathyarchaeia archaeon]
FCPGYFCVEHRLPESHGCPEYWRARAPHQEEPSIPVLDEVPEYPLSRVPEPTRPEGVLWFSFTELKHLTLGILMVMAVGLSMTLSYPPAELSLVALVALTVIFALSFILHELAHKLTAQRHGLWAEFRLIPIGVLMTLFSILFPIKFLSPGAVMIAGYGDPKTLGKISMAGPLTSLALSLFFRVAYFSFGFLRMATLYGSFFNALVAVLNLIPFGIFDGATVFRWNKGVWAVTFLSSLALLIWAFA